MTDIASLVAKEEKRQREMIGLIPSENHSSPEVLSVLSSCLSSKYSEGYPGRRYYEGNQVIDEIERLAIERMRKLFGVPYANVQPYSGSPANAAILFALLEPGDTLAGLALGSGGHLTHGHPKVTFSGRYFDSVQYGLGSDARIDFDALARLVDEHRPKAIIAGTTSYPFVLDFARFREIADRVDAWLIADISHVAGLVVGGEHPSPVEDCDVVMTTTHKSLRGPRGAVILVTQRGLDRDPKLPKAVDAAVLPGLQGGPHNATTAAIAVAASEASRPGFRDYARRVRANAAELARRLSARGVALVGGGTENHLMVLDLTAISPGFGTQAAIAMDVAGIYANRNAIPDEPSSAFYPSGVRIGTPLVTTRGMRESEMERIAGWIRSAIGVVEKEHLPEEPRERARFVRSLRECLAADERLLAIRAEVRSLASSFPLFSW